MKTFLSWALPFERAMFVQALDRTWVALVKPDADASKCWDCEKLHKDSCTLSSFPEVGKWLPTVLDWEGTTQ